jgi:hypothetical protein
MSTFRSDLGCLLQGFLCVFTVGPPILMTDCIILTVCSFPMSVASVIIFPAQTFLKSETDT